MIFTFLTTKLASCERKKVIYKKYRYKKNDEQLPKKQPVSILLVISLLGSLALTGCQPPSESTNERQISAQTEADTKLDTKSTKPGVQSDSAAARIEEFESLYVEEMQELQQRLQAEYEALQAADIPNETNTSSAGNSTAPKPPASVSRQTESTPLATDATGTEVNISTEVGERDLEVLKLIRIEPRKPSILTENQLIERYQQAMQALYEPASIPLSAENIDTLLNIMTLLPQLFEHAEIAERVSIKSPALARLITQHQVWQQIEVQQALDMEQMKLEQQQEFEALMDKFNDTIAGYDEQIAKYEQTLEEFQ